MAQVVPIVLAVVGAATSTVALVKQGQAESEAADFNAKQSALNADLSRKQAAEDERAFRIFSRKQLADIKTGYAASGVSIEGGSASDVLEEGAAQAEMDALKIREGGERRAQGFQNDATLYRMRSSAATTGGYLSGAASLLQGASRVSKYAED